MLAVVIPTFDRPDDLRSALASVTRQTRQPEEVHVVIDGGPGRDDVAAEFADRLPLRWHRLESNSGQAAARNHALARSEADGVAFLDDDDLFCERHLERLERALRQAPGNALVYDDAEIRLYEEVGSPDERYHARRIALEYDAARMRRWDYIPPSTWLARAETVRRAGGFDASLRCYEDWDLLLRLEAWGGARRAPGLGAVVRIRAAVVGADAAPRGQGRANQSLSLDANRMDALARFQAKHGLDGITPMTFWEVAVAATCPLES